MTILEMGLRILLAMVIGGIIGWERETNNRPAGLRTHMLVTIGAAVIMLIGEISLYRYADVTTMDPTRLGAQVISGIGFLGAGTIMREGVTVKGLTTAASLWAVACLGLASGGGFYEVAIGGTIAILLTLTIFEHLEKRFMKSKTKGILLELECEDLTNTLENINEAVLRYEASLADMEFCEIRTAERTWYTLSVKLAFNNRRKKKSDKDFLSEVFTWQGILKLKSQEYQG